jgi:hypothetical protein
MDRRMDERIEERIEERGGVGRTNQSQNGAESTQRGRSSAAQ